MIARDLHRHSVRYLALLALAAPATLLSGVTHEARASSPEPLLPDLVADPPDGIELATDSSTGTNRLLLRFNGYIHNKGPGAVDFRGTRVAPKLSAANEKKVKEAEEKKEGLPQGIEEELAASPMKAFQRLFTTKEGQEETNIERAHVDETSPAELIFASADGHHHWHLQHAAKYSLWNAAKTAEVAPAQKVGFCLDDSQHVEAGKGPATAVYADNVAPFRDFCQQYRPNATSLFEGISPGWRDLYSRELAFQWVDASNVLPGEYWLREEVNPTGVIKETGGANVPVYAPSATTIPGFDALAKTSMTAAGEADTVTLTSTKWGAAANPVYAIVAQPQHGTLSAINGGKVTYTPSPGYSGPDSFSFSADNPSSQFPTSPAVASVSLVVGEGEGESEGESEGEPAVAIEGAQASIVAGMSVQLSAQVTNDSSTVTWAASAGTITQAGLYTAPSEPGSVTVTATTSKGAKDQKTIKVVAPPPDEPAPESSLAAPGGSTTVTNPASGGQQLGTVGTLGSKTSTARIAVSRPVVELVGRTLVMTDRAGAPGRIRLSAYLGKHRLGTCATLTPAGRSFTCRVSLPKQISLRARIRVVASLRDGAALVSSVRAAAPVAPMRMAAHASSFWCSPGSLHLL
jgi:Lysyl oxidase/Bacterial Ig domain